MIYILYTIFFISCLVLVVTVLLQPGKTDAGALFTSNISGNAFGPRGTQTVLSKVTITAAVLFMLSALFISLPAFSGTSSVLANNPAETSSETVTQPPISDLNTNANVDTSAPANTSMGANTATQTVNIAPANAVTADAPKANTAANTAANTKPANAKAAAPANANKK